MHRTYTALKMYNFVFVQNYYTHIIIDNSELFIKLIFCHLFYYYFLFRILKQPLANNVNQLTIAHTDIVSVFTPGNLLTSLVYSN